jgi:cell division protein FtsQ
MANGNMKLDRNTHRKKIILRVIIAAVVVIAVLVGVSAVVFRASSIEYIGGTHYAPGELNGTIFGSDNPNILFYKLFGKKNKQITFVQKYDVDVTWPDKITVTVYEKPIVGYISYMGCNMYFDKDGTVVESSSAKYEGVPEIEGLEFKSIVLNSKLEIDNLSIFSDILDLTQAFDKYQLGIEKIYFDSSYDVTLYMDDVKVELGSMDDCTEKLFALKQMEDSLKGMKGTLYLSDFNGNTSSVIFKKEN